MSNTFEIEKQFLDKVEDKNNASNNRTLLVAEQIENLKNQYTNLPKDFLDYLVEIGEGSFRKNQFQVNTHLSGLADFGLDDEEIKPTIKFFGDNFSGDLAGFGLENKDDKVVEFWHDTGEIYQTKQSFKQYIRTQMLMDENGNDLRE